MRYCVTVSYGNDCDRFENTIVGELSEIAEYLIDESNESIYAEGMTLKELEEWYCCDFDDYRKLKRRKKNFPEELIRNYYFQMSDQYVSVSEFKKENEE